MAIVVGQPYSVMQARRVLPLVKFNIRTLNDLPGHRGAAKMHAGVNSSPLLPLRLDNLGYEVDTDKRDLILTKATVDNLGEERDLHLAQSHQPDVPFRCNMIL
jgi:hypothetical protein